MLRFANPQSDPIALRELYKRAVLEPIDAGAESVDLDTMADRAASAGILTSSGAFGADAIRESFTVDRSLDGAFNQAKMLSEVYRMFGWLRPLPDDRQRFVPTPIGRQFAMFTGARFTVSADPELDELAMWRRVLASLVVPPGAIETQGGVSQRPFLNLLRLARNVGGALTLDEMIATVFQADDDRRLGYIEDLTARIERYRSAASATSFEADLAAMLNARAITLVTARNYLRLPARLIKEVRWFEVVRFEELSRDARAGFETQLGSAARRRTYYRLTDHGYSGLDAYEALVDVRTADVPPELRPALCLMVHAARRGIASAGIAAIAQTVAGWTAKLTEHGDVRGLLCEPFQQFPVADLVEAERLAASLPGENPFETPRHMAAVENFATFEPQAAEGPLAVTHRWSRPASVAYAGVVADARCMACSPAPCTRYGDNEVALPESRRGMPNSAPTTLCPTDAISIERRTGRAEIVASACIACGICASRCPVGAIAFDGGTFQVANGAWMPGVDVREGSEETAGAETRAWQARVVTTGFEGDWATLHDIVFRFHERVRSARTKDEFYPLVRNLLRQLGFSVALGRSGDVNWRFDALVYEPFVATIELKSPGETERISVSATRQAVENAAIAISRFKLSANPANAVIGYEYPAERSDVRQALLDTKDALGISVIVLNTAVLCALLLLHRVLRFDAIDLHQLFYAEPGPVSVRSLEHLLRSYFARRLEQYVNPLAVARASLPVGVQDPDGTGQLLHMWSAAMSFVATLAPILGND